MLDALRKGAGSIAAKILLGILILSFAVWGVGDMVVGGPSSNVATVAGENVSIDDYRRRFDRELTLLSIQLRQRLTPQNGRGFGLDQRVLGQLLVDAHARDLGLGLSDEAVAVRIQSVPSFQDDDGKFSKARFDETLRQLGFSEQGFVHFERLEAIRGQIVGQLRTVVSSTLLEAVNRFENEERTVDYFAVPVEQAGAVPAPDEAKLKEFYDQNLRNYVAPETRKLSVVLATPEALKGKASVTEEEVRAFFEGNQGRFGTPERRKVQQITFPDKAAAEAAYAALVAGKDFLEVAKVAGRTEADIDRGTIGKEGLLDPAIAEAAFALAKDTFSKPVEGALSTSIVRVGEITAATIKPFEEVKAGIRDDLLLERARRLIGELHDKIEDLRAAATPLKDIAAQLGLKHVEVPAIDKSGNGKDGVAMAELKPFPQIVKLAYESDVGVETDPVDLGREGYAWVDVLELTPERQKPLEEVRDALKLAYVEAEGRRLLGELVEKLGQRAGKGEDMKSIASEIGASALSSPAFKRAGKVEGLPPTLPQRAFTVGKGGAASVASEDGKARVLFRVTEVIAPKPLDDARRKELSEALARQSESDLTAEYAAALEKKYGLVVNQSVFQQIIGEANE